MIQVGLLGGGTIGESVASAWTSGWIPHIRIVAVAGRSSPPSERVRNIASTLDVPAVTAGELLDLQPDWLLEAAGVEAAIHHARAAMERGINVIVCSIGALADADFADEMDRQRDRGAQLMLPSGAIGGLDAIRSMNSIGGLHEVEITTTKAPAGLVGAPFLEQRRRALSATRRSTVFVGSAKDAIEGFPQNVNVAVALALAGLGLERTRVRIRSDPFAKLTTHRIRATGDSGSLDLTFRNKPHPRNPRTSWLAGLSAISALQSLAHEPSWRSR